MSFCPIEDAFQDPFLDRIRRNRQSKRKNNQNNHRNSYINNQNNNQTNNHNNQKNNQKNNLIKQPNHINYNDINEINNVIENFECLDGHEQLEISDEYQYKNMLSRQHPQDVDFNVQLNNSTKQLKRPDEQLYYPDMSLENEYALLTDVKQHKGQAYRPPNPFTQEANPSDIRQTHPEMYESFNESDQMMAIDSDMIRSHLLSPRELVSAGNDHPMMYQNHNKHHKPQRETDFIPNSKLNELLENQKDLESKLDQILNRLNKLETEGDGKENIHDIILFGIFGIFFIYILDSVYKIGKKNL